MTEPVDELHNTLRAHVAEIPAHQAENDGWPQRAMPAMLKALGLSEAPEFGWFVAATNPLYDMAAPEGWRYCHVSDDPVRPDLLGIAYGGSSPEVYLRADVPLPLAIQTLGHELWHVHEFATGKPADEQAADKFGAEAAARFWVAQYR
jgi:hypothetical protein